MDLSLRIGRLVGGLLVVSLCWIAACRAPSAEGSSTTRADSDPNAGAEGVRDTRSSFPEARTDKVRADKVHAAKVHTDKAHTDKPTATLPSSIEHPAHTKPAENRDKHGERDVEKYIERLESPERVADLQVDRVVSTLAPPADAEIGDLGCGPGLFALAFARSCPQGVIYASDVEPRQLDAVRAKIAAAKLVNIVPVLSSYDDPHFPPAHLDIVFIGDTYHHLEDRVAYMRRLQRALKPGGRVVILDYKPGQLPVGPPPEHKLKVGELEREMLAAGYKRVDVFHTHPHHDFEVWRVTTPWERK